MFHHSFRLAVVHMSTNTQHAQHNKQLTKDDLKLNGSLSEKNDLFSCEEATINEIEGETL